MTTKWAVALAILTAACGKSQENGAVLKVQLHSGPQAGLSTVSHAKAIAAQILASAGVRVDWMTGKNRPGAVAVADPAVAADMLEIMLDEGVTTGESGLDVMGYALPFQSKGVRVHVFMGRIRASYGTYSDVVLGHVLAHEIGHVLEGVARHSSSGVLKAQFSVQDLRCMAIHPAVFAPEDVSMIQAHFPALAAAGTVPGGGSH